jgi:hypothetical protein
MPEPKGSGCYHSPPFRLYVFAGHGRNDSHGLLHVASNLTPILPPEVSLQSVSTKPVVRF